MTIALTSDCGMSCMIWTIQVNIYIYIYIYILIHTCIHTCIDILTPTYTYTNIHTYICLYVHILNLTYTNIHVSSYIHTHTYIYIYIYRWRHCRWVYRSTQFDHVVTTSSDRKLLLYSGFVPLCCEAVGAKSHPGWDRNISWGQKQIQNKKP